MRVLIVDDEPPARARLRLLLAAHADVQLVGEAGSARQALAMAETLQPELLMLDVRMPDASGLDVAASLPEPAPRIVFVSAHADHALPAFDAAALDYLLKPVAPERLAASLQRVREALGRAAGPRAGAALAPAHLLVPDRGRTHVLPLAHIQWLQAADNYVVVHTAQGAPLLRRPLAALLRDLGSGFQRVHRSAAVGLAHVREVRHAPGGEALVCLAGGAQVPCSRAHRAALLARLPGLGPAGGAGGGS